MELERVVWVMQCLQTEQTESETRYINLGFDYGLCVLGCNANSFDYNVLLVMKFE